MVCTSIGKTNIMGNEPIKMLPCPFCGVLPVVIGHDDEKTTKKKTVWHAEHTCSVHIKTEDFDSNSGLIEAWNQRIEVAKRSNLEQLKITLTEMGVPFEEINARPSQIPKWDTCIRLGQGEGYNCFVCEFYFIEEKMYSWVVWEQ